MRFVLIFLLIVGPAGLSSQSSLIGGFTIGSFSESGISFNVYQFSRDASQTSRIKAKYFARNAYTRFNSWKSGKKVLVACAGAFSESWEKDALPHGFCVDNGDIVNRKVHLGVDKNGNSLDGLVLVYGGGRDAGGLAVKDIEHGKICAQNRCFDIKNVLSDRVAFSTWASKNKATVFQLPLMYSHEYGSNYGALNYGDEKERRFLAVCKGRDGVVYHLIVDVNQNVHMNLASYRIKEWVLKNGFTQLYGLLVLDTGGKDIFYDFSRGYGKSLGSRDIDEATNLLVYYVE